MDTAQLTLRIQTEGMTEARRGMDELSNAGRMVQESAQGAERATASLSDVVLGMATGMLTTSAILAGLKMAYSSLTEKSDTLRENSKNLWLGLYEDIDRATRRLDDYQKGLAALSDAELKGVKDLEWQRTKAQGLLGKAIAEQQLGLEINGMRWKPKEDDAAGMATFRRETDARIAAARATLDEVNAQLEAVESMRKERAEKDKQLEGLKKEKELREAIVLLHQRSYYQPDKLSPISEYDNSARRMNLETVDFTPATVNAAALEYELHRVATEGRALRREIAALGEPSIWQSIAVAAEQSSYRATDALVTWMDNLDGVGRSWKTLGDTVRSVIADMLIQMQRAIIQQQVMAPLIGWATQAISGWATGTAGGSPSFNTGTGNFGDPGFDANFGIANPSGSGKGGDSVGSIVVNVSTSGETTAVGGDQKGVALGRMIGAKVREVLVDESRPGGLLARA